MTVYDSLKEQPAMALDRLAAVGERIADTLERIATSVAPLERAAKLVPTQKDRILENLYAAVVTNAGKIPTVAGAEELTSDLLEFLKEALLNNGREAAK